MSYTWEATKKGGQETGKGRRTMSRMLRIEWKNKGKKSKGGIRADKEIYDSLKSMLNLNFLLWACFSVYIKTSHIWQHAHFLFLKLYSQPLTTTAALQSSMWTILHIDTRAHVKQVWQACLGVNWTIQWLFWNKKESDGRRALGIFPVMGALCTWIEDIFTGRVNTKLLSVSSSLKEDCWWV